MGFPRKLLGSLESLPSHTASWWTLKDTFSPPVKGLWSGETKFCQNFSFVYNRSRSLFNVTDPPVTVVLYLPTLFTQVKSK